MQSWARSSLRSRAVIGLSFEDSECFLPSNGGHASAEIQRTGALVRVDEKRFPLFKASKEMHERLNSDAGPKDSNFADQDSLRASGQSEWPG